MAARPILLMPGPIEYTPEVLEALARPTENHFGQTFISIFGDCLRNLRTIMKTETGQPFIINGTGVLTWDLAVCNLLEPGDKVLLVNTGYFGDRFGHCVEQYGFEVHHVRPAALGQLPSIAEIEAALKREKYKAVLVTHVETSTGVLTNPKPIAELVKRISPESLVVVDGVCSIGAEELHFDAWGIDCVLTACQKALGVPPGLVLLMLSTRAMTLIKTRKSRIPNYYGDLTRWLPVMEAYEAGKAVYFSTPAVNLVAALQVSLAAVVKDTVEYRWKNQIKIAKAVRRSLRALGLQLLSTPDEVSAHVLSAVLYPSGVDPVRMMSIIKDNGAIMSFGLHPDIRNTYFRFGHMGHKSTRNGAADVILGLEALEVGLKDAGLPIESGTAVSTFKAAYAESD